MKKIVLISCVKTKLPHKAKAKDLYISSLFRYNLKFARQIKPDEYLFYPQNMACWN